MAGYKCIVVGGSYAAISSAIALGRGHSVTLICGRQQSKSNSYLNSLKTLGFDPYVGLWTGGLECLENIAPGAVKNLEIDGRYIEDAYYTNSRGKVLARTSQPLKPFNESNIASILFIQQSKVLQELKNRLPKLVEVIESDAVDILANDQDKVSVKACDGTEISGDLLVAADGRNSIIRKKLSLFEKVDFKDELSYRGYIVFRGTSKLLSKSLHELRHSFQSWSQSHRFAAVPVQNGISWFATVPACNCIVDNEMSMSTTVHSVSDGEKQNLLKLFDGWHPPIPEIIQRTKIITMENALEYSTIPTTAIGRALLVGDAAYCLDPILAQGINVCFEDSNELLAVMDTLEDKVHDEIPGALAWIARQRKRRAKMLRRMSNALQRISHAGEYANVRDMAMTLVPPLTNFIFDHCCRLVANKGRAGRS